MQIYIYKDGIKLALYAPFAEADKYNISERNFT